MKNENSISPKLLNKGMCLKNIIIIFSLFMINTANSQSLLKLSEQIRRETTRQNDRNIELSFFTNYTNLNRRNAVELGVKGGIILRNRFLIGANGSFFINSFISNPEIATAYINEFNTEGGVGGLYFEWIIFPHKKYHFTIPLFANVGMVYYMNNSYDLSVGAWFLREISSDNFKSLQPGIEFEINMSDYFRFAFGMYYRFTTPVTLNFSKDDKTNIQLIPPDGVQSLGLGMSVKVGYFGTSSR